MKLKTRNQKGGFIFFMVIIGLACVSEVQAQLNIKIGYNLNYSSYAAHNSIFEDFNAANPWLAEQLKDLHFSSGMQFGARFRGEFVGVDATWERATNSRSAQGIMPDGSNFSEELDYTTNRISAGLEGYGRYFGLGTSIFYEIFNVNSSVSNLESDLKVLNSNRFGSKVYLILSSVGSDYISVSLQPYVAIPWRHHNLSQLARTLGVTSDRGFIQENLHFGFSLVFYNGLQRN